ncbi:double zinc ribbon domain-containing protein [Salinirussus salinus]|uniref:double zinc ribbon domain-containing protein n=1 Tax=Salinirussus salinus TaxID=1198300 RepID=UPI001357C0F4|nr:zinc ribbon domain-containing protein [Salinirussus salinus]
MSKITFRADDELIRRLEEFDASKSEVMREALREYLDGATASTSDTRPSADPEPETLDEAVADRVDALIADRLEEAFTPRQPRDVNVNITLDGDSAAVSDEQAGSVNTTAGASHDSPADASHTPETRKTGDGGDENAAANESKTCSQCGETVSPSHVYCPNCGEKTARRVFCDCGDELRSDWGFCPGCGRRTPAADVLDQG